MGIPIVGTFFRAGPALIQHVASCDLSSWRPYFVVLHNTAPPTLAQRLHGFCAQNMDDLADFYEAKGWHAGPHWFVDDRGCWAFSRLDAPGVHSPSWNHVSWGVEQLGDFDTDAYDSGRGALVRDNAVFLLAVLSHRLGVDSATLRFHKQDPLTEHKDCPGAGCDRADVVARVHHQIGALIGAGLLPAAVPRAS